MKILFYDLETTGLLERSGITQFAAILVDLDVNNSIKVLDSINLKMCPPPGTQVESTALEKTGLTIDQIKSFQPNSEAFKELLKFLDKWCDRFNTNDKLLLAGYNNSRFDDNMFRLWFTQNGNNFFGAYFWSGFIDVMSEASRYLMHYRPALSSFRLGNVAQVMGIQTQEENLHDGLYDIKLTVKIFAKILKDKFIKDFDPEFAEKIYMQMLDDKKNKPKEERKERQIFTI